MSVRLCSYRAGSISHLVVRLCLGLVVVVALMRSLLFIEHYDTFRSANTHRNATWFLRPPEAANKPTSRIFLDMRNNCRHILLNQFILPVQSTRSSENLNIMLNSRAAFRSQTQMYIGWIHSAVENRHICALIVEIWVVRSNWSDRYIVDDTLWLEMFHENLPLCVY